MFIGPPDRRPLVCYDTDCLFCCLWVNYWRLLTSGKLIFRPYQEVQSQYPDITDFAQYLYFIDGDIRLKGAHATFAVLSYGRKTSWLWCYFHLPFVAYCSEKIYRLVARHRNLSFRLSCLLWGNPILPQDQQVVCWLFLRGLALIYLFAFASFIPQILGLVGHNGILPAADFLEAVSQQNGQSKLWNLPTLLWLDTSDRALFATLWGGVIVSVLLFCNLWPRSCLLLLFILYLSVVNVGQVFTQFQWDSLLLESGFLALFLHPHRRWSVWLLRWLLFRFIFLSGAVKLLSMDPYWANLSALTVHFETQPLPTLFAWYVHQLPPLMLQAGTLMVIFIELLLPFLIFLPSRPRLWAAIGIALLQFAIILTGNYNFFNLLTLLLCLLLLDDHLLPTRWRQPEYWPVAKRNNNFRWLQVGLAGLLLLLSSITVVVQLNGPKTELMLALIRAAAPWHIVNYYGVFAVMTADRYEILLEGSLDGNNWQAYQLPYQPQDVHTAPGWLIPYQPRLDWQMWFAALSSYEQTPWFRTLMVRLIFNSTEVLALFKLNPFADIPPVFVRASLYRYEFTDFAGRQGRGQWWQRTYVGTYAKPMHLTINVTPID